jgi:predicted MPP superfamily phosphohydrolase
VRELPLPISHLPESLDGLRLVAVSDLHLTPAWHNAYDRVIEAVTALQADLVLVVGDIVDDKRTHVPARKVINRLLPSLPSRMGTFGILGNHDSLELGRELEEQGIRMLVGQRVMLESAGATLELIGAPGPMRKDLPEGFAQRYGPPERGVPRILMAHFPDHFPKLQSMAPDVYVCGHTHAGQVCLPGGLPLLVHDRQPRRLCRGYHRLGRTHYIVSHGLGFSGVAIRAFCPPEILLLVLRRA